MLKLSDEWRERLIILPETGMTYTVATIVLKDGRTFPQSIVCDGCITRIRGIEGVPFSEEEIAEIVATRDKWDWKNELPCH